MPDELTRPENAPPRVGLLVVHGIGEQRRGETTEKLVAGLKNTYGGRLQVDRGDDGVATGVSLDDRVVRLYEVYWADLLSGERVKGTFRWEIIQTLCWFPSLSWKAGWLSPPLYRKGRIVGWSLLLVPLTWALYFAYMSADFFASVIFDVFKKEKPPEVRPSSGGALARIAATSQAYAEAGRRRRTVVQDTLDTFVGDVTNYMASVGKVVDNSDLSNVSREIGNRFYGELVRAEDDGCDDIHILSHSLGTVVMYHSLTGALLDEPPADGASARTVSVHDRVRRIYTIGSPLEKIRFFWPTTIAETIIANFKWSAVDGRAFAADGAAENTALTWDNFRHKLDAVAGRLQRFDCWTTVKDHVVAGSGGVIRAHLIYERSPQFLGVITGGLFGEPASPPQSTWGRWSDKVVAILENLILPVVLTLLVFLGIALGLGLLKLMAVIMASPLRLFRDAWVGPTETTFQWLFLFVMGYGAIFGIRRKARRIHARWQEQLSSDEEPSTGS